MIYNSILQGNSKVIIVTLRNQRGENVNLTGATINYQIAMTVADTVPLVQKSVGNGIEIPTPTLGKFKISIDSSDTQDLMPDEYYHEARVRLADGTTITPLSGELTIIDTLIRN